VGWWPRVFEGEHSWRRRVSLLILSVVPSYIVLFVYASYPGVWRTYSHWVRFSRAPPCDMEFPYSPVALPNSTKPRRPTSSFYPAPTRPRMFRSMSKREHVRRPTLPARPHSSLSLLDYGAGDEKSSIVPALQMRYFTESVYSVQPLRSPSLAPSSAYTLPVENVTSRPMAGGSAGPSAWKRGLLQPILPTRVPFGLARASQAELCDMFPSSEPRSGARSSASTFRSIMGLIRPALRGENRSSALSEPFTWSMSDSDFASFSPIPPHLRADDASDRSRYSSATIASPTATGYRDSYLDSYLDAAIVRLPTSRVRNEAWSHDVALDSVPVDRQAAWMYPEEVFIDFGAPPEIGDAREVDVGRTGRWKGYQSQRI
jgi:hypothetical protein